MIYAIKIEHVVKGLSESSVETVLRLACGDDEKDFEERCKAYKEEAKEKFNKLTKEYKTEIFYLVELKYEKNILAQSGGVDG